MSCAAILILSLSSCANTERCWKITVKVAAAGTTVTTETYVWGTEVEVAAAVDELKKAQLDFATLSYAPASKSKDSCYGVQ